ncbi:MAG: hypothetical protein MUF48_04285 [Pirellulaceae bacterium]|jgi:hypothetical protein|nr:hypothetical protein [Pirellulaceae bacterium]
MSSRDKASPDVQELVDLTRELRESIRRATDAARPGGTWRRLQRQFAHRTGQDQVTEFAEAVAQAVACGHYLVAVDAGERLAPAAQAWLTAAADEPLLRSIWHLCLTPERPARGGPVATASRRIADHLRRCVTRAAGRELLSGLGSESSPWPGLDFCERFLQRYDRRTRRRHGVYTTPQPLARFVVHQVDELLRREFALDQGLADVRTWADVWASSGPGPRREHRRGNSPFVCLLDPAMGSGIFLLEVVAHMRRTWERRYARAAAAPRGTPTWDQFVNRIILPRLWGQDVLLSAVVSAQLLLTAYLAACGYTFRRPARLELHLGNTLRVPRVGPHVLPRPAHPFTVVLGNPPFAGLSQHHSPWLKHLLHGHAPDGRSVASYLQVAGAPLGERKHWLHDDYVKFLRVAHWLIETADAGIVALVTNHALLDNTTFRGLRAAVLETFPGVRVVDLHGNTRAAERAPDGTPDESVFGIEQGVAVSLLRRPVARDMSRRVEHAELWGARAAKLDALDRRDPPVAVPLAPQAPHFLLVPQDRRHEAEYLRGYRLTEIMPVHGTAAVTARDRFVVGFTTEELQQRIATLRDETISDAEIRQQYFTTSRSPHYLPGDTRGWSLAATRQRLRHVTNLDHFVQDCLYRPFDWRKIFWAPWMVDWPRERLMSDLLAGDNLALVTRRQSPTSQAWTYAWITDTIALDGLIRSDNRGSESVFPLYVSRPAPGRDRPPEAAPPVGAPQQPRRANLSSAFVQHVARATGLRWTSGVGGARADEFNAAALFYYVYALLHAPGYRQRYAPWLRVDFPRVFVPASAALFGELAALGARLASAHLLRDARPPAIPIAPYPARTEGPRFGDDTVHINAELRIAGVSHAVWEFRVGSYQVCKKWLQERRGRWVTADEIQHYARLLAAVQQSLQYVQDVEHVVEAHGGWSRAFLAGETHSPSSSMSRAGS